MQPSPALLVVEDDEAIRLLIQDILQDRYRVETAEDALRAAELLEQRPFALLIIDLRLPVLDGMEFIAILRRQPAFAQLPVLALSVFPDLLQRLSAGLVQGRLRKPFSVAALRQAIADILIASE